MMKITEKQQNSIIAIYSLAYDEYMRWYRKKPKYKFGIESKKIALKCWKEHLLNFQMIIIDVLKIDATFKEFKGG